MPKISELSAETSVAADDLVVIVDVSAGTSDKAVASDLVRAGLVSPAAGSGAGTDTRVKAQDAGSGNSAGGSLVLEPGLKSGSGADGVVVIRQPGGVAGTDEIALGTDGTDCFMRARTGFLGFDSAIASTQVCFAISPASGYAVFRSARGFGWSSNDPLVDGAEIVVTRSTANLVQVRSAVTGAGGLNLCKLTPAQLTGDVNDYAPGAGWNQRWSADAARNVTGMAAGEDGEVRFIWNVGTQTITLKDESTSTASSAANRFLTATGADLALATKKCAMAYYDSTSSRWRVTLLP